MIRIFLFFFIASLVGTAGYAQPDRNDYDREFVWGLNKNSRSDVLGGITFKVTLRRNESTFHYFGLDLMNIKHPLEQRYPALGTGSLFVWGKSNKLFSIRGLYGQEKLLYRKASQQGVQVSFLAGAGPSVGLIVPYYILYDQEYHKQEEKIKRNNIGRDQVQGSGKLFQGFSETSVAIGANAKAGLAFEFGTFKNNIAGVEMGVMAEAYTKKIEIMATQDPESFFSALYLSLFWGTRR